MFAGLPLPIGGETVVLTTASVTLVVAKMMIASTSNER